MKRLHIRMQGRPTHGPSLGSLCQVSMGNNMGFLIVHRKLGAVKVALIIVYNLNGTDHPKTHRN